MTEDETQVRESIRRVAEGVSFSPPPRASIGRRARAIARRRTASGVIAAAVLAISVGVPIAVLADLGDGAQGASEPSQDHDAVLADTLFADQGPCPDGVVFDKSEWEMLAERLASAVPRQSDVPHVDFWEVKPIHAADVPEQDPSPGLMWTRVCSVGTESRMWAADHDGLGLPTTVLDGGLLGYVQDGRYFPSILPDGSIGSTNRVDPMTTTLTGDELARALAIRKVEELVAGDCGAPVEVEEGGAAYCIPEELELSRLAIYRVSRLLQGHFPTDDELARVQDAFSEDAAALDDCAPDEARTWQTVMRPWLTALLMEVGSPEGWDVSRDQVQDTGSALRITVPEYEDRLDVYVHLGVPDMAHDPRESMTEVGTVAGGPLYLTENTSGTLEQYFVADSHVWLTLYAYAQPPVTAVDWTSPGDPERWLNDAMTSIEAEPPVGCVAGP